MSDPALCVCDYSDTKHKHPTIAKEEKINKKLTNKTEDFVTCCVCDKKLRLITPTHLKTHGITIKEYHKYWPSAPLSSGYHKKNITLGRRGVDLKFQITGSEPEDYVVCRICELKRVWIAGAHLLNCHSILTKEYERMYPDSPRMSLKMKRKRRKQILGKIKPKKILKGTEPKDYVICRICKKKFEYISHSHLRTHNITLEEYKKINIDAPLKSNNYISKIKSIWVLRKQRDPHNLASKKSIRTRRKRDPTGEQYKKTIRVRTERYGKSGARDPKARGLKISKMMKNGGTEKGHLTRKEKYGPSGISAQGLKSNQEKRKVYYYPKSMTGKPCNPEMFLTCEICGTALNMIEGHHLTGWFCKDVQMKQHLDINSMIEYIIEYPQSSIVSPHRRKKMCKITKNYWKTLSPEEKEEYLRNSLYKANHHPNISEGVLIPILKKFGFVYTGGDPPNETNHKPDFTHVKYPLLIEYDGPAGHDPDLPWIPKNKAQLDNLRNEDYRMSGYEILVLVNNDLHIGIEHIKRKVEAWMGNTNVQH